MGSTTLDATCSDEFDQREVASDDNESEQSLELTNFQENRNYEDSSSVSSISTHDFQDENTFTNDCLRNIHNADQADISPLRQQQSQIDEVRLPFGESSLSGNIGIEHSTNVRVGHTIQSIYRGQVKHIHNIRNIHITNSSKINENVDSKKSDERKTNIRTNNGSQNIDDSSPIINRPSSNRRSLFSATTISSYSRIELITCGLAATLVFVCFIMFYDETKPSSHEEHIDDKLEIVSRDEWVALEPEGNHTEFQVLPLPYVIISQSETDICLTKPSCIELAQIIQAVDKAIFSRIDILNNFLIGGDGRVYEGRGWKFVGDHTENYNEISIGISFIGSFESDGDKPTKAQLNVAEKLLSFGVENKYLRKDYKLKAKRDLLQWNFNPGNNVYNIIKTWDHWAK